MCRGCVKARVLSLMLTEMGEFSAVGSYLRGVLIALGKPSM